MESVILAILLALAASRNAIAISLAAFLKSTDLHLSKKCIPFRKLNVLLSGK